jgi:hypothetical protein
MKKMLLLFFASLALGLGHGTVVGMDAEQLATFESPLSTLSDTELQTTLTNLILGQWTFSSGAQVQAIRTEINRRDPNKPYKITLNDPEIISAFIKKVFSYKAPTVAWFLDRGIPVDGLDSCGYTALMTAISRPAPNREIVETLLKNRADQNIQLVDTQTSLATSPRLYAQAQVKPSSVDTQEMMKLMNKYNHVPAAAPASSTAGTSSTASTTKQQTRTPHPDRRLIPSTASTPANSAPAIPPVTAIIGGPISVMTEAQFPRPRDRSAVLTPRVTPDGREVRDLTSKELEKILIMINNEDKEASYYEDVIRRSYQDVNFNSYVKRNDGSDTYINPLLYALEKNNAHGLAWAQFLYAKNSTILENMAYPNGAHTKLSKELKNTPLSAEARTWLQSKGVPVQQPQVPKLSSLQWNATKTKIVAAIASMGVVAGLYYRWWTSSNTKQYTKNVLINNTGADIFINGSDTPLSPNAEFDLPENSSQAITITLHKDQDDAKDLKINMADYVQDMKSRHLNLSIGKKWFANWFLIPLTATPNWVEKTEQGSATTK